MPPVRTLVNKMKELDCRQMGNATIGISLVLGSPIFRKDARTSRTRTPTWLSKSETIIRFTLSHCPFWAMTTIIFEIGRHHLTIQVQQLSHNQERPKNHHPW